MQLHTKCNANDMLCHSQSHKTESQSDYLITKGKRGQNATIDRIDNRKGYSINNIQLLTNRINSSKGDTIDEESIEELIKSFEGSKESLPF